MDIRELIQDNKNFNKGTKRGEALLSRSFERFGAARPILIDKNNRIIAGNKSAKEAEKQGINDVLVIETDGTELVVVKRKDIGLDTTDGRELALVDNITAKVNYALDYDTIMEAVDEVKMDSESWGIKNAHVLAQEVKEEFEEKQRTTPKTKMELSEETVSDCSFMGIRCSLSKEEHNNLKDIIEKYYEENGLLCGFIAEFLDI